MRSKMIFEMFTNCLLYVFGFIGLRCKIGNYI